MSDMMPLMQPFTVADLNAQGEIKLKAQYRYQQLEQIPGATDLITELATALYRSPDVFEIGLPRPGMAIHFRWRSSAPTAGLATVRCHDHLASVSVLATGLNEMADRLTLESFQQHLLRKLHDTGFEPGFGLMDLRERPLLATVNFFEPPDPNQQLIVALADRCFAAAYLRYHGLA